jgi:hypothetical protein
MFVGKDAIKPTAETAVYCLNVVVITVTVGVVFTPHPKVVPAKGPTLSLPVHVEEGELNTNEPSLVESQTPSIITPVGADESERFGQSGDDNVYDPSFLTSNKIEGAAFVTATAAAIVKKTDVRGDIILGFSLPNRSLPVPGNGR